MPFGTSWSESSTVSSMTDRAISMRLPTDLLERLDEQADLRQCNRSQIIRRVLTAWCDKQEQNNP